MKVEQILLASGFLAGALLAADDPHMMICNFDNQYPGETPERWGHLFGRKPTPDIRVISNVQSVSGRNSLLIDYASDSVGGKGEIDVPMCGFYTKLPTVTADYLILSFCFRVETGGVGFELRPATGGYDQMLTFDINADSLKIKDVLIGECSFNRWYRLTLRLPAAANTNSIGTGRLDACLGNGVFQEGKTRDFKVPPRQYQMFDFVTSKAARIYIDDFMYGDAAAIHP